MRKSFLATLLMFGLSAVACGRHIPPQEELLATAKAMDDALGETYNRRDIDGFMKNYLNSSDLVLVDQERILKGSVAWRQEIIKQFKDIGEKKTTFNLVEKHYLPKADHVYGWGTYQVSVPSENAPPLILNGIYTSVKSWQNDKLVTVMETYTRVPQP